MTAKRRKSDANPTIPPPPAPWRGARVWSSKFTDDDIRHIRAMAKAGWSIVDLAKKYKTTWHTMKRIVSGESWAHVT